MKRTTIITLVLLVASCGHKVQTQAPAPVVPQAVPADEQAYREGLAAFRLATPEGYLRAVTAFRKATELNKTRCEYTAHLAESLYFLAQQQRLNWEDYRDAVGEANAIVEFKGGSPECNSFASYLLRLRGLGLTFANVRTADAVAVIRQAIDADPNDAMNWVVLAQLNPPRSADESVLPIQRAVEIAPDLAIVQYELGNSYLSQPETYPQAKQAFERVLQLSPRHFQAMIGIVYALSIEGDDAADRVEPLLHQAVEAAPSSLKARTLLGDYYSGLEETEQAVTQYSAAIGLNPKYYPAHLAEGTTLVTADQSNDAETSFKAVVDLEVKKPHPPFNGVDFSADAQAHYFLGNIWLERGDLAKARVEYLEAVNDIPNFGGPIYGLGIVAYRQGKVEDALGYLDKVLQLNARQFPNAFFARGGIRAERRQFAEALRDFNSAIEIYQQQVTALEAKVVQDESKGLKRRAEGDRRRKALIEATLQKALESKKAIEP